MVTILLEQILELLKGWLSSFTSWAEDVAEKLGLIEEQTEYIDDILDNTDSIAENTLGIKSDTGGMRITLNNANARLSQIYSDTSTIKNNVGSISTSAGTAAAFSEDIATNTLNTLDKVTTIASDTTQIRADNTVVKADLDKIYEAIKWSLLNVETTETETNISPLTFDTDKADNLIKLRFDFNYTMSGSGDPTPTNIRTITGYNDINYNINGTPHLLTVSVFVGNTVYSGYADLTDGKIIIDEASFLIGDYTWSYIASYGYFQTPSLPDLKTPINTVILNDLMCECYTTRTAQAAGSGDIDLTIAGAISNDVKTIRIKNKSYTDPVAFATDFGSYRIVYPLENPITYTFTPVTTSSIIGLNTITSNCNGNITVTYKESVKHYLDKQEG